MTTAGRLRRPALVVLAASLAPLPTGALAQGVSRCPIRIARAGPLVERPDPERTGAVTAFLSGPVTVTCGDAVMNGDSAVWVSAAEQALMIGSVRYRDTTRTLNSNRLTYNGPRDEVVAEGSVRLVRLSSGATLEGPRVTFTRTPFAGSRTVATSRPRMTLPAGRSEAGGVETSEIDADVAEFIGETEAFARGDVILRRRDLTATADSARFSETAGRAVLYGRPVVTGEGYVLSGDSIVAGFSAGDLEEIQAFGDASATGERYELRSEEIRARLAGRDVETIWAFGEGRSVARSQQFVLAGDSIVFAFVEGRADSVTAVGSASAVQVPEQGAEPVAVVAESALMAAAPGEEGAAAGGGLEEPALTIDAGANWLAGDTVRAKFVAAAGTTPAEVEEDQGGEEEAQLESLWAVGTARSFYAAVRDSTRSGEPSRNYLLGSRIEIRFRDGEPSLLTGTDAIGVYLEPIEQGEGEG